METQGKLKATYSTFLMVLYRLGTRCGILPYRILFPSPPSSPQSPLYPPGTIGASTLTYSPPRPPGLWSGIWMPIPLPRESRLKRGISPSSSPRECLPSSAIDIRRVESNGRYGKLTSFPVGGTGRESIVLKGIGGAKVVLRWGRAEIIVRSMLAQRRRGCDRNTERRKGGGRWWG